ncbi:hypothetical protein Ccrd_008508, partial [Cynara cardunculus var. scolymus]
MRLIRFVIKAPIYDSKAQFSTTGPPPTTICYTWFSCRRLKQKRKNSIRIHHDSLRKKIANRDKSKRGEGEKGFTWKGDTTGDATATETKCDATVSNGDEGRRDGEQRRQRATAVATETKGDATVSNGDEGRRRRQRRRRATATATETKGDGDGNGDEGRRRRQRRRRATATETKGDGDGGGSHAFSLHKSLSAREHAYNVWLSVFLLLLMEVQVLRRFYKTIYIFNYSLSAIMHIFGSLNLVAEFIVKGKDRKSKPQFSIWMFVTPFLRLRLYAWLSAAIFLWGWVHQLRCHEIL